MADIPVWMKSAGLSLAYGLIGIPLISRLTSWMTSGPPSRVFPTPLKILPSMSIETSIIGGCPVNRTLVSLLSIPLVPSKTCRTARSREISRTCPVLSSPEGRMTLAISPNETPLTY